ncbi:hypothetical protein GCM10022289_04570 [Pedobacter jeongneungensis]|uniref:Knr4/Smi1-like domain-containing protein n=1 Tax=Pedobacter jeongneungensis TaxID=947309 RepID=A0ABP8B3U5_9SPHI
MESNQNVIKDFYKQLFDQELKTVFTERTPSEMMNSEIDTDGWFCWKPVDGTFDVNNYRDIEKKIHIEFLKSFIEWHKLYFFLDCDCSLIRLPHSSPSEPLKEITDNLDNDVAKDLILLRIYPFGQDGNDIGLLVFDGRYATSDNEFPIRIYDYDYNGDIEGLSEIIFSSFPKLLECISYFLQEIKTRKDYEIIPDFFNIDPSGAGKTGVDYWLEQIAMAKGNDDFLGN